MLFSTALRLVAPTSVANKSSQPSSGIISECHPQIFYSHEGDYLTVVGLPLSRTVRELRRLGWPPA
ncbi:hypothetical protein VC88_10205 [Geobacillus sp. A8]|nr:hypothetical protein VC88_10205 [Geobacillus sp. A8]